MYSKVTLFNKKGDSMDKKYRIQDNLMIYSMPEELDHHVAQYTAAEMDLLIETNYIRTIVMDFSKTLFMDSSGIGTIIGRCKKMKYLNGRVKTRNMNQRIYRLFTAAGLHRIGEYDEEK